MYTGDRGTLLTFPLMCFHGKICIRLINMFNLLLGQRGFVSFFTLLRRGGKDDLAGATVFFTSATRVVVPTDRETDGTDLVLIDAAGRCFPVTG